MVKPPILSRPDQADRARDQREIRDWHTLVAKLASEAETLHSWTERRAEDSVDEKIQGTLSTLASGLAGDARRLASAMPDAEQMEPAAEPTEEPRPKAAARLPGTGEHIDRSV
jgi:hypothetical protein